MMTENEYGKIADIYDDLFNDEQSLKENEALIGMIGYKGGSVLDVGCGTGLFLDYTTPDEYLGIDESENMLRQLKKKHPKANVINVPVAYFESNEKYDYILALFGVGSYLTLDDEEKLFNMLAQGGKAFFVYYKEGYYPVTYKKAGIKRKFRNTERKTFTFDDFDIYVYENL